MNNANCLALITNNIKGIQNNSKQLSAVEYFENKLGNSGILFLQETNSTFNDKNIWKNDFNVPTCLLLTWYFSILWCPILEISNLVNKQVGDKNGRTLIGLPASAGRVRWNRVCLSVLSAVILSVRKFSPDWLSRIF